MFYVMAYSFALDSKDRGACTAIITYLYINSGICYGDIVACMQTSFCDKKGHLHVNLLLFKLVLPGKMGLNKVLGFVYTDLHT